MTLQKLLKNGAPVLSDGAMGTYFAQLSDTQTACCEFANLDDPELILRIHREYVEAGARFLRTNTFAANTAALGMPLSMITEIVKAGYRIACDAAGEQAVVAADFGPIYMQEIGSPLEEYCAIADAFIACGAKTFLFETFADTEFIAPVSSHIKHRVPDAEIIASFALSPDGRTRAGIPLSRLLERIALLKHVNMIGFNCGCGPTHMISHVSQTMDAIRNLGLPLCVMPNAGYPALEFQRTVFDASPEYFAQTAAQLAIPGVGLIGGCCGTTPAHIAMLAKELKTQKSVPLSVQPKSFEKAVQKMTNRLQEKLSQGKFVTAAELAPPADANLDKLLSSGVSLREAGIDIVTISDSTLARAKLDSIVCSARLSRETGLDVLPHLCCRDRNLNALRSALLAAHSEGIRSVLAVTGDQVPEVDRGYIKPVFNVGSMKLMEMISKMNEDVFMGDPLYIGGALNPSVLNPKVELERLLKKMENGARFFLTQPVYTDKGFELIDMAREQGAKVLVGILPLVSWRNAHYMSNEVPGMNIPEHYLSMFRPDMPREEAVETGIEIAVRVAEESREHADGFYFITPFNRGDIICALLNRLRAQGITG